jgi:murein DD-endopeptidase MepM/ murein hydrolase activator NlpD
MNLENQKIGNMKQSATVILLGSVFIALCLLTLYFTSQAARYTYQYKTTKNEIEQLEAKLKEIEAKMKNINAYSDAIEDLTMSTINRGEKSKNDKLESVDDVIAKLKDYSSYLNADENINNRMEDVAASSERLERTLKGLVTILKHRREILESMPSITPVAGWFSSGFGNRMSPFTGEDVVHRGIDIVAEKGTNVHATAAGKVIFTGYSKSFGKVVIIRHPYNVVTKYAHNSKLLVRKGQTVKRGDAIAKVGSTGRSTGPHSHYEVWVNNKPMDPKEYFLDHELENADIATAENARNFIGGEELTPEQLAKSNALEMSPVAMPQSAKQIVDRSVKNSALALNVSWKQGIGYALIAFLLMALGYLALDVKRVRVRQ